MPPHLQALLVKAPNPGRDEVVGAFPITHGAGAQRAGKFGGEYNATSYNMGGAREMGRFGDSGSTARFFYSAKANKADRAGSKHPTVKPVGLIRWLARLITPPGGVVLDPFAGSGTTAAAALAEGFRVILCEREDEYVGDIIRRITAPDLAHTHTPGRRIYGVFADEKGRPRP